MKILGLSAFYHDSAAALVVDGELVAAAQEERFTRKKHDSAFPTHAVAYCLESAGLTPSEVDHGRFLRQAVPEVRTIARDVPDVRAARLPVVPARPARWIKEKLFQKDLIAKEISAQLGKDVDWTAGCSFPSTT